MDVVSEGTITGRTTARADGRTIDQLRPASFERDFTVIQGVALIYGVLVVLVNLLTDVAYVALDPRVRFDA